MTDVATIESCALFHLFQTVAPRICLLTCNMTSSYIEDQQLLGPGNEQLLTLNIDRTLMEREPFEPGIRPSDIITPSRDTS
jgi:hypothetical protein